MPSVCQLKKQFVASMGEILVQRERAIVSKGRTLELCLQDKMILKGETLLRTEVADSLMVLLWMFVPAADWAQGQCQAGDRPMDIHPPPCSEEGL